MRRSEREVRKTISTLSTIVIWMLCRGSQRGERIGNGRLSGWCIRMEWNWRWGKGWCGFRMVIGISRGEHWANRWQSHWNTGGSQNPVKRIIITVSVLLREVNQVQVISDFDFVVMSYYYYCCVSVPITNSVFLWDWKCCPGVVFVEKWKCQHDICPRVGQKRVERKVQPGRNSSQPQCVHQYPILH